MSADGRDEGASTTGVGVGAGAGDLAPRSLLQYLAAFPAPDGVVTALAVGALRRSQPARVLLHTNGHGKGLACVASHGPLPVEWSRYLFIPPGVDVPPSRCARTQQPVFVTAARLREMFPALGEDADAWRGTRDDDDLAVACVPILVAGQLMGVLTVCPGPSAEPGFVVMQEMEETAAALALWISHPDSGVAELARVRRELDAPLDLTARQMDVLTRVAEGRTSASIAAAIGFSESTVKLEVQRMMNGWKVRTRSQLVHRAVELGLLPAPVSDRGQRP